MRRTRLRAGDAVVLRPPADILATLDERGRLDGLPFMPEMLAWFGQTWRVSRRVDKTCTDVDTSVHYPNRRFPGDDVVLLERSRCNGSAHAGCDRGCRIFWKEAWLRRADETVTASASAPADLDALRNRLQTRTGDDRFVCQSTELFRATAEFPGKKKPWLVRIALREVLRRELSAVRIARLFGRWSLLRLTHVLFSAGDLEGPNTRTPTDALRLAPGERVRIKSRADIVATLDAHGRNRGMGINREMTRLCGLEADVRARVERIIDERTGAMRAIDHSVALQNVDGDPLACDECLCSAEMGDCPRGELMYWREIWLERATPGSSPPVAP